MTGHDHAAAVAMFGDCPSCARTTRDQAIAHAAQGAPAVWMADAQRVVRQLADAGHDFCTDDIWLRLRKPPEPRAMGAVMRWAVEQGLVINTGRTVQSVSAVNHARPITVWAPTRTGML